MQTNWLKKVNFVLALAVMLCAFGVRYHQAQNTSELTMQNTFAENRQEAKANAFVAETLLGVEVPLMAAAEVEDEIGEANISFEYGGNFIEFSIESEGETKINWGDGNIQSVKPGKVSHKYSDTLGTHKVQIEDKVYFLNISGVKGVKNLSLNSSELEFLDCANTEISELDLSKCENLKYLVCNNTNINELDLTACEELEYLYYGEGIKSIKLNEKCKTGLKLSGSSKTVIEYAKAESKPEEKPVETIYGDVTEDGVFDGRDVLRLGKYIWGYDVEITEQGFKNADVNLDGKANGTDLLIMQLKTIEMVEFPYEGKIMYGDVNVDGVVDDKDLLLLTEYINVNQLKVNAQGRINADVNMDGSINGTDVAIMARILDGDEISLPAEGIIVYGDARRDGKLNSEDVTILTNHIEGKELLIGQGLKNADFNGDGQVNQTDVTSLRAYLASQTDDTPLLEPGKTVEKEEQTEASGKRLSDIVKLGDYVEYIPSETSYSVAKQTYNPSLTTSWRVLTNDETNKLQIIPEGVVSGEALKISGQSGYDNLVQTLNNFSAAYVNEEYAVSGRSVGTTADSIPVRKGTLSYRMSEKNNVRDNLYTTDLELMEVADVKVAGSSYWLGSRDYIQSVPNDSRTIFFGRSITEDGNLTEATTSKCQYRIGWDKSTAGSSDEHGVRPVITLKDDLVVVGGKGTAEDPYKIGTAESKPEVVEPLYGDANEDGVVDIGDIVRIAKYIGGYSVEITEQGKINADVNGNGKVDETDIELICQKLGGYDIKFPAEGNIAYGDANEDGVVDIGDIVRIAKYIGGYSVEITAQGKINADVNGNGKVDETDIELICQKLGGYDITFPVKSKESSVTIKLGDTAVQFADGSKEKVLTGLEGEALVLPEMKCTNEETFVLYVLDGNGVILNKLNQKLGVGYKRNNEYVNQAELKFEKEAYELTAVVAANFNLPAGDGISYMRDGKYYEAGSVISLGETYLSVERYLNQNGNYVKYYKSDVVDAEKYYEEYGALNTKPEVTYKVEYISLDRDGVIATQTKKHGEPLILSDMILTREDDHIFTGWYVDGTSDRYDPGATYTKDESVLLVAEWVPVETKEPVKIRDFIDVKEDAWYYEVVTTTDYLEGTTSRTFSPDDPLTREMFIAALYNVAGNPSVSGTSNFPDVYEGSWSEDAIVWATKNNLVSGNDEGRFKPSENITRQEAIVVLMKYAKYAGYSTEKRADLTKFADTDLSKNEIYDWAVDAMSWAVAEGIISGNNQNELSARENLTRAQMTSIFDNLLEVLN